MQLYEQGQELSSSSCASGIVHSSRCQPYKCGLQDGRAYLAFVLLCRLSIRA